MKHKLSVKAQFPAVFLGAYLSDNVSNIKEVLVKAEFW